MEALSGWWEQVWVRLQPDPAGGAVTWVVLAAVAAAVLAGPVWRRLRVLVTVVHELGHALVGVLGGRRFTGLVLRGDMSGHAVTVGPARGPGLVLTAWAGYPAPAIVGAAAVQAAAAGWAPPLLGLTVLVLLLALLRVRSFYTAAVVVGVGVATAALWWWAPPTWQAQVLAGTGLFQLIGSWRHLAVVAARPGPGSDVGVLARLTRVPRWCWLVSFALVLAAATWWAWLAVRTLLGLQ
ncbi:M50 family metallopeptidase [Georgenia sp. TF02-10]|uniref:M50 family metallopeptidase n=1 Tax=Georgenia sp. TF02-10 TaxID=2917725 RepID=UPI001FA75A5D|nr:M50 family metallopeptidase [Georgenia sp. TF02-10]UNX54686.1 M50 family metallopeptidase [Georgenia sp. TF02-10]